MFIGHIAHRMGAQKAVSEIPYLKGDDHALTILAENRMRSYTQLDTSIAGVAAEVAREVVAKSNLPGTGIDAIVFTHLCEANNEKLDEEMDAALVTLGLHNTPLYHISGGQCGTGAMQLQFVRCLLEAEGMNNVVVLSSNVVPESQTRNQVGNTVVLSDGAVGFLASGTKLDFEVVGTSIRFDHELRSRQASRDFTDSLRAFQLLSKDLDVLVSSLEAKAGIDIRSDVKKVITSNSYNAVRQLTQVLKVDEGIIFTDNIPLFAHSFGNELYHSLDVEERRGAYSSGDLILLYHCGYSALGFTALRRS